MEKNIEQKYKIDKPKVLIVEDDNVIALSIMETLTMAGYSVTSLVDTGEEAIKKAVKERPDLALMDITLKGEMDGIDAAVGINSFLNIPIIYITASGDNLTFRRAKLTGPFGYLIKPFADKDLLFTVEMALYKKKVDDQLLESSKMALLGKMSTCLAHEINQPLTYISSSIQTILEEIESDNLDAEFAVKRLKESGRQVKRLTNCVNHLLAFGRPFSNEFKEVNILKVINNSLAIFKERMQEKNIHFALNNYENLPMIKGNECQLEQVFLNLMQNSFDALQEYDKDRREISLSVKCADRRGTVQIKFTDSGPGISHGQLKNIFSPFYTTKPSGKGTGLGLYISRSIIESHRGEISCRSKTGNGTSFLISLPSVKSTEVPIRCLERDKIAYE